MVSKPTQAQIFAGEYAKGVASEMLANVKGISTKANRITKMVLAVTMPHQIAFVLGIAPLRFDHDVRHWLESISLILASVLIPIAVDYLILTCIQAIATRGMAQPVKRTALIIMLFPVSVSAFFNIAAPAPTMVRILFGVAVVLIPLAEGLRAIVRPDFAKIEQLETEVTSQLVGAMDDEPDAAEDARRAARSDAAKRAAAKRAENRAAAEQEKADRRERRRLARLARQAEVDAAIDAINEGKGEDNAPVSPSPYATASGYL